MHKMSFFSPSPSPSLSPPLSPPSHAHFILSVREVKTLREISLISSVVITIVLLLFLFFLGRIRRSVRGRCHVRYVTKVSYLLVPISITYIMGALHKDSNPRLLSPIWAAILIYAYGGVVTISACDLNDNEETLRYVMRTLPLFFWTAWLGFLVLDRAIDYWSLAALFCTLVCFLGLAVMNTRQTLEAFYKASKSKGLPREVEPLVRYMEGQSHNVESPDPRSMRGFKCMVWGHDEKNAITIEDIWKWVTISKEEEEEVHEEGRDPTTLARKRAFLAKCGQKDRLRDMCLSYALFRILLIRFAAFPPICDSNPTHPRRIIQEGILQSEEPQRVFRIIEVELEFLSDYFYTKSHVCGSYRFRDIWQHIVQILLLVIVAMVGIPLIVEDRLSYRFVSKIEVTVTWAILLKIFLLECCKYIMVHYSNRKIVWLLCTAIRETASSDKWASTTRKRFVLVWTIKSYIFHKFDANLLSFFRPWQRKLGQYSFLESYGRVPILARGIFSSLARFVRLPRRGQWGDKDVSLSKQVKQAIVSSLLRNPQLNLSQGRNTIARYQLPSGRQSESTVASFILVWHIATSFCESLHPIKNTDDPNHEHFLVANQLSKYCAYLLAFSPELLPDHVYTTERFFDKAVHQAIDLDMQSSNNHDLYQGLITRAGTDENIIERGALLAHQLSGEFTIQNANRGWIVLAEFWAEVLLYLAQSDNVSIHGEYLARGGEFITHLWVLLTHLGVLTRNPSSLAI